MVFYPANNATSAYMSLADAAKKMPGQPHISTLHRWRLRGVRGVRLQTMLIGGRRFVTEEALAMFMQQINAPDCSAVTKTGATATTNNLLQAEALLDREQI